MPCGRPRLLVVSLLLGSLLSGCGRKHLSIGPEQRPIAAHHMELAEQAIEEAERLQIRGRNRRADLVLARAEADAELAVLLSRDRIEQQRAQAMRIRAANLRSGL